MSALASDFLARHGYAVVLIGTMIDGTGFPFPGRLLLVAAGAIAATANLDVLLLILLGALGAVLGDHLWYCAGWFDPGHRLLRLYCRIVRGGQECVDRAGEYLRRFGPLTFVVGRMFAAVRILAAPLAAGAGITYRRFLLYDVAGALAWAGTFVLVGHLIGTEAPGIVDRFGTLGAAALGTTATAAAAYVVWRRRRASRPGPG